MLQITSLSLRVAVHGSPDGATVPLTPDPLMSMVPAKPKEAVNSAAAA
jgi:hypothetical protein